MVGFMNHAKTLLGVIGWLLSYIYFFALWGLGQGDNCLVDRSSGPDAWSSSLIVGGPVLLFSCLVFSSILSHML